MFLFFIVLKVLSFQVMFSTILQLDVVIHEMLHAMGGRHEQSRMDRPHYMEIMWNKIKDGYANNFDVADTKDDAPYDLSSVMQYDLSVRRIVLSPFRGSCRSVAHERPGGYSVIHIKKLQFTVSF